MSDFVFGWREGLLGLIALLAIYMVVELLRIRRLRQRRRPVTKEKVPLEPTVHGGQETPEALSPDEPPGSVAWDEPPPHLVQDTLIRGMESELVQMREELDALRGEFAALRTAVQHELEVLRASQTVSPLYSEAMQMAVNGYSADVIAERCSLSRAEAELVVSLGKNQER